MSGTDNIKRLSAMFERDHDRLLRMLDDAAFLCSRGSRVSAAKVYSEFRRLQENHLAKEEALLEQLVREGGCPAEVAARVSHEHSLVKQLIEQTWSRFNGDAAALAEMMNSLVRAIGAHERMEKEELLPVLCSHIRDPQRLERAVYQLTD